MGQLAPLPKPGSMVALSGAYNPPVLRGIKVFTHDPLKFDFILDLGDKGSSAMVNGKIDPKVQAELKGTSDRLIKYFLTTLTVPDNDIWVNLSPYEKDRIATEKFGQTEMGRDLLGQDYLLKQITASLMFPEGEAGKKFWSRVYAEAQKQFGSSEIPVDTFNKVWIMPAKAVVYEKLDAAGGATGQATAFVVESSLKVMLESDYIARKGSEAEQVGAFQEDPLTDAQKLSEKVAREVIIPILEKEVNTGENFAPLRQVYNSILLALWYKEKVKGSILASAYVNRNKVAGVDVADKEAAQKIWQQYVEAFRKGAFNMVNEEKDPATDELLARKYFAGGFSVQNAQSVTTYVKKFTTMLSLGVLLLIGAGCSTDSSILPGADVDLPGIIINGIPEYRVSRNNNLVLLTVKPSENSGRQSYSFNLKTKDIVVMHLEERENGITLNYPQTYAVTSPEYRDILFQMISLLMSPMMDQRQNADQLQEIIAEMVGAVGGVYVPAADTPKGYLVTNINGSLEMRILPSQGERSPGVEYYGFDPITKTITVHTYGSSQSASGGGIVVTEVPVGSTGYRDVLYNLIWALQNPGLNPRENATRLNMFVDYIAGQSGGFFFSGTTDSRPVLVTNVDGVLEITIIHGASRISGPESYSFNTATNTIRVATWVASQSASGGGMTYNDYDLNSPEGQKALLDMIRTLNAAGTASPESMARAYLLIDSLITNVSQEVLGDITVINMLLEKDPTPYPNNRGYSISFIGENLKVLTLISSASAGSFGYRLNFETGEIYYYGGYAGATVQPHTPEWINDLKKIRETLQKALLRASPAAATRINEIIKMVSDLIDNGQQVKAALKTTQTADPKVDNSAVGGIDLKKDSTQLDVRSGGGTINFKIDPAQLERINAAPGLAPRIFTIDPLKSLPAFLGMSKEESQQLAA